MPLDLAQLTDRQIDGNAEEPCIWPRFAAEAVDLGQAAQERFLGQLARFFVIPDDSQDGVIEPVLIERNDLTVCRAITVASFFEKLIGLGESARSDLVCQIGLELCVAQT